MDKASGENRETSDQRAVPGKGTSVAAISAPGQRPESPRDLVIRDIVTGLYEGRYLPGQRITEADLTGSLGVSRGPVREALNRLEAAGLIALTQQRGAQIRRLTVREAIDILVVVESLIGLAARYAAENIDVSGARVSLKAALDELMGFDPRSLDRRHAVTRNHFYAALAEASGNMEIRRILSGVQTHLVRVQFRAEMQTTNQTRHADYQNIVDAVFAQDAVRAEAAARAHIRLAIDALEAVAARDQGQA